MTVPVTDTVTIDVTEDTVGVSADGFGDSALVSFTATWAERSRTYSSLPGVAADFATTSYEHRFATVFFSQSPKSRRLKIVRAAFAPTAIATLSATPRNSHPYTIDVKGRGVTATSVSITSGAAATAAAIHNAQVAALNAVVGKNYTASFAALIFADATFTASAATDEATIVAHGLQTGDGPMRLSSTTTLPAGLAAATDYFMIRTGANTFKFATSLANALAGTAVDLTDAGTGTHTMVDVVGSTKRPFDPYTVTGSAAGEWFSLEVNVADMALTMTHADPGIATDLAAIVLEDSDWYCLVTPAPFNSNALVTAAAAWAEASNRLYFADVLNTSSVTAVAGGGGNDVGDNLKTSAYANSAAFYTGAANDPVAGALASRYMCTTPGATIAKFRRLVGVKPVTLTDTHRVNLRAKNMNWLESSGSVNMLWDGRVAKGGGTGWIDVTRNLAYVKSDLAARCFNGISGADIVGYDRDGYAVLESKMRGGFEHYTDTLKIFSSYAIEMPDVDDADPADVEKRHVAGLKGSARLRGAAQSVGVGITVSVS